MRDHAASTQRLETAAASYTQANAAVEIAKAMQLQQETRLTVAVTRRQLAQASLQQQIASAQPGRGAAGAWRPMRWRTP